jgi:hypothetical protein
MAEQSSLPSAIDYSKLPLYGATQEQLESLRDAQQQAISALEARYAQPNLFKVAAGFLKPQLGGFGASLGSASEALAENIEQQRAQALPIAQMRAQLAQSNLLLSSATSINEEIKQWMAEHPGQTPPASKIMEWRAKAPQNPTVQSLAEQQKLTMDQQAQALQTAKSLYDAGQLTKEEYARRVRSIEQAQAPSGTSISAAPPVTVPEPKPEQKPSKTERPTSKDGVLQFYAKNEDEAKKMYQEGLNKLEKGNIPFAINIEEAAQEKPKYYSSMFSKPDIGGLEKPIADEVMKRYAENTAAEEKKYIDQLNQWGNYVVGPQHENLRNQFDTAVSLIENNPQLAKKVFNLLRGEGALKNQILSAFNEGIGVNIGSTGANINLPVKTFIAAGLGEKEQMYADRLVNAMLNIGNAKLALQGISPKSGQEQAYFQNLLTKANLDQNPATALNILHNDLISFNNTTDLFNQVQKEKLDRKVDPNSMTPNADIFASSPEIKRIQDEARQSYEKRRKQYQSVFR